MMELRDASSAVFLTLTYSEENLPYKGEINTLVKDDVQKFLKRVRDRDDRLHKSKKRYFLCGEYGEQGLRPHYHLILMNLHPDTIKSISKIWKLGYVKVGTVTKNSIHYVTNYMHKVYNDYPRGAQKPFTTQSRRPGLGANYIDKYKDWHNFHEEVTVVTDSVNRPTLPPYYVERIFQDGNLENAKDEIRKINEVKKTDYMDSFEDWTDFVNEKNAREQRITNTLNSKRRIRL